MAYRIKWESVGPNGKRCHHSATRETRKQADAFLTKKLGEVNEGSFVVASTEIVAAYLERWLAATAFRMAESTAYQYESEIRTRITPHIGHLRLARLDELTIQSLYATLIAAGYAASTVNQTHRLLSTALKQAVAWRLIQRNPVAGVTPPPATPATPAVWTAEESALFLAKTAADPLFAVWQLGLDSGMRVGEMLALSWRDLDADRGVVAVQRTLTRTRAGSWKIGEHAKTSSSRRSIALGPSTVAALRTLRVPQAERRLACGQHWSDLGLIFDRGNGEWINPRTITREFGRALDRVQATCQPGGPRELPDLTPHGMRHTMATVLLVAGVHPKVVQERLGHKSVQITLDRYSHVTAGMQREAADVLEELLWDRSRPRRGQETM